MKEAMASEDKPAIRALLEKALETGPQEKAASGIRAQLAPHRDLIVQALRQGYSATSLARFFAENGIEASVDTLRAYVAEVAGKKRKKPHAGKAQKEPSKTRQGAKAQPREQTVPQTPPQSEANASSTEAEGGISDKQDGTRRNEHAATRRAGRIP
jgi:hypothetical protein